MRNLLRLTCAALALCLFACGGKTPEDRLTKAREYMSQRDLFSAESELRKIIDKSPDDPMAAQARYYLAQIYNHDKRYNEAIEELEVVIAAVPQSDTLGRDVFKMYLQVLTQTAQFDKALDKITEMEKAHTTDPGMALNFKVGRADLLINARKTTEAREILFPLLEETTHSETARVYTNLILKSHGADGNTTAGTEFLKSRYEGAAAEDSSTKMNLAVQLAMGFASVEDYEQTRRYIEEASALYDDALAREVQPQIKAEIANDIAQLYQQVGNLPGAEVIYQVFRQSGIPQLQSLAANELAIIRVRNGDTSAAISLYKQYGEQLANPELQSRASQLQQYADSGQLSAYAPLDTQTLTLRFRDDTTITLKNLSVDSFTTQTQAALTPSTGTFVEAPATETSVSELGTTTTE